MKMLVTQLAILISLTAPAVAAASTSVGDAPSAASILTPPAPPEPRINGPRIAGVRPGSPFLFRIPCTGKRPMSFEAEGLPEGLVLDPQTGIITGSTRAVGTHNVKLYAQNALGETHRDFRIVVGDRLALTPPMGWNSWYIFYRQVSDANLRQSANQMIASGMADYGYQYVNSDDCWMQIKADPPYRRPSGNVLPYRDASGNIRPGPKFPDMAALTAYIHAKGLKAGIYTSPGPWTCAHGTGAYQHEVQDARQFAAWGFDFLKYDWCSYSNVGPHQTAADFEKPYRKMWDDLQTLPRDIVFNLCEYGWGDVWTWGGDVGNCWRTTPDLGGTAGAAGLPAFYKIGLSNEQHWQNARPGAWNDPDYLIIGWIGAYKGGFVRTKLTPDEQYSYMSMWSLMAAPLIFSGDMGRLDPFTLNILCNSDVIDVDQDPLGRQGRLVTKNAKEWVMVRDLEDGSKAIGLFNVSDAPEPISIRWADLGLSDLQNVRDLWREEDLGLHHSGFAWIVPPHGVKLIRVRRYFRR